MRVPTATPARQDCEMGKANRGGQKRKEAPARKQLQGRGGNSGLLHKNNHKRQHGAAGLDGEDSEGREGV